MFSFLAIRAAKPFVVDGILRAERDRFFSAGDGLIVLLQFIEAFGEQQEDFRILGVFGRGLLQELNCLGIVAYLVSLTARFEIVIGTNDCTGRYTQHCAEKNDHVASDAAEGDTAVPCPDGFCGAIHAGEHQLPSWRAFTALLSVFMMRTGIWSLRSTSPGSAIISPSFNPETTS